MPRRERYQNRIELLQGTLDLLILQTLQWGPRHGYGIAQAIQAGSSDVLQVDTGSLYPALHRLEKQKLVAAAWELSANKQRTRVYRLTRGRSPAARRRTLAVGPDCPGDRRHPGAAQREQIMSRRDDDLRDELRSHLEMATADRLDARRAARRGGRGSATQLGNPANIQEATRDVWGRRWLERLAQDVRYALRTFRRNPGFATVAILSLALGIGANTAIFAIVDAVRLRALPVADPSRLIEVHLTDMDHVRGARWTWHDAVTNPIWEAMRARQMPFATLFAWGDDTFSLSDGGEIRYANGLWVSGGFFGGLGLQPADRPPARSRGRPSRLPGEGRPRPRLLAARLWRQPGRAWAGARTWRAPCRDRGRGAARLPRHGGRSLLRRRAPDLRGRRSSATTDAADLRAAPSGG